MRIIFFVLFLITSASASMGQNDSPFNRRLFIHGGGSIPKSSRNRFVEMAGGKEAKLIVVPTATSDETMPSLAELEKLWGDFGIKNIQILHTRDPLLANRPEFSQPLADATAVWFGGGSQQRLSRAYAGTEFEKTLRRRVDEGLVVGGSSAGAAIQSRFMIAAGRSEPRMARGLNLLPNSIIDQHFLERSRLNRLARATEAHPGRIGIGISENTTLVINGQKGKVLGPGFVVAMRSTGEGKLDLRSWDAGSNIEFSFGPVPLRKDLRELKGVQQLFADRDELDSFLLESAQKAESFRQAWLKTGQREAKMKTLARLTQRFLKAHKLLAKDDSDLRAAFACSPEEFEQGFVGFRKRNDNGPEFESIFQPFAGEWSGQWAERTVDHQWSKTLSHSRFDWQGLRYRMLEPTLVHRDFQILRYQYAWIGDGYGVNIVASEKAGDESREYILGYVEHLDAEHLNDNNFSKVVARRPHVGISLGAGKLIWVTAKEVFFEEAFKSGESMAYSIIGFRYEISDDQMVAKEGFQTQYIRQLKGKQDKSQSQFTGANRFKSFKLHIQETRR